MPAQAALTYIRVRYNCIAIFTTCWNFYDQLQFKMNTLAVLNPHHKTRVYLTVHVMC